MQKLFFTILVTFSVFAFGCAKKKSNKPSDSTFQQKLYGYWELETANLDPSELPLMGAMYLELNRNNITSIDYCLANKKGYVGTIFSVKDGSLQFEHIVPGNRDQSYKFKITRLTSDYLQLEGKFNYHRINPTGVESGVLNRKVSPFCSND